MVLRVAAALVAFGAALAHLAGGEASLPLWIWNLAKRVDLDAERALRLLAAVELTFGLVILLCGRAATWTALVALLGLMFASIAEVTARLGSGASIDLFVGPGAALVVSGALFASRDRWWPRPDELARRRPGLGSALAVVGLLLFSMGATARLPIGDRPHPRQAAASGEMEFVFPNPEQWIGDTIPSAGLGRVLPRLTADSLEGRHLVVFHSARCGRCHDLFRTFFSDGSHPEVIAVEVPPPREARLIESDQPESVQCLDCRRLVLPEGPAYFRHLPMVLVVENGRITCVEHLEPERCLLGP